DSGGYRAGRGLVKNRRTEFQRFSVLHVFTFHSPSGDPCDSVRQQHFRLTMDVQETELESLEGSLRRNSALAMRTLRSATTACAQRDAARAHGVLAFEPSARRDHPTIEVAA